MIDKKIDLLLAQGSTNDKTHLKFWDGKKWVSERERGMVFRSLGCLRPKLGKTSKDGLFNFPLPCDSVYPIPIDVEQPRSVVSNG